jgi:hypothetical protein
MGYMQPESRHFFFFKVLVHLCDFAANAPQKGEGRIDK